MELEKPTHAPTFLGRSIVIDGGMSKERKMG